MKLSNLNFPTAQNMPALLVAVFFFLFSCSKESNNSALKDKAKVSINMSGVNSSVDISKVGSTKINTTDKTTVLPFNDEYAVVATVKTSDNYGGNNSSTTLVHTGQSARAAVVDQNKTLSSGTKYTIAVYTTAGAYVTHQDFTYTVGQTPELSLAPATYTFVVVASGNNSLPTINFNQPLSAINWTITNAAMDVMYFKQDLTVQEGTTNNLNVLLKHAFTEVEVTVNSVAIGTAIVVDGTVTPSYSQVNFGLANGNLDYANAVSLTNSTFTFPTTTGTTMTSNSVFLFAQGQTGTITVPITINGTTKPMSYSLGLNEGVRYEITLRLQKRGLTVGGQTFSPGNLTYDQATGNYGFSASNGAFGDYFFAGYVKAKKMNIGNVTPNVTDNGGPGDPCALAAPTGTWRLPTQTEATNLILAVRAPGTGGNWQPYPYQNNTLVDHFNGSGTNLGMFFGTQTHPAANQENILFLAFGGYYNNTDQSSTVGEQGRYLVTATAGGYTTLHLTGTQGAIGAAQISTLTANTAVQIRCIK